ncbi:MAG: DUF4906 domain-containing protein [Prevotellaceae bacterium]|nr:DUF4906 domain-containing protein [Prevotellaceae bacterium]
MATWKGILLLFILSLSACVDEAIYDEKKGPEGLSATLNLSINVTDATLLTRAGELDNRINTLAVAIYNANSGERTFYKEYGTTTPGDHDFRTLTDVQTKSGNSYIVAVANAAEYDGITTDGTEGVLSALLNAADTWEKFKNIAVKNVSNSNTRRPNITEGDGMLMSGYYLDNTTHPASWEDIPTVYISPGMNNWTGNGAIHLRRTWSQIEVNVAVGNENISEFELESWQIVNVPYYSWVLEQSAGNRKLIANGIDDRNAGDVIPLRNRSDNYVESPVFRSSDITRIPDTNGGLDSYSFNFWMMENKRTGTATTYADREREWTTDGEYKNEEFFQTNTGLYTALCPTNQYNLNNEASYIVLKGRLQYRNGYNDPNDYTSGSVTRTASVTYVVHLGYINNDATDFNNFRNSHYTYNITVNGVHNILVEAHRDGDAQPGAEGIITDTTDEFFILDAHYGVLNIYLAESEVGGNFNITIDSYYDGQRFVYSTEDPWPTGDMEKFFDWAEFYYRGTEDPGNTIPPYPGLGSDDLLNAKQLIEKKQAGYYTVFIKEYSYEDESVGNRGNEASDDNPQWWHYANQPDRHLWIRIMESQSVDANSTHYTAKYAISQKSIQTYYDDRDHTTDNLTAFGVEHTNESFGMNVRWTTTTLGNTIDAVNNNTEENNGRYNCWRGMGGAEGGGANNTVPLSVQQTLQVVNAANPNGHQYIYYRNLSPEIAKLGQAHTEFVPMNELIGAAALTGTTGTYNGPGGDLQDPQYGGNTNNIQYLETVRACMNRNRDLDGNGTIDPSEMRWYVPASAQITRIVLAAATLPSPMMDYTHNLEYINRTSNDGHAFRTRWHMAASNSRIIWLEEGVSSSSFYGGGNATWQAAPWEIRCIRSLGTDLRSVAKDLKAEPAYDDSDWSTTSFGGMVKIKHYPEETLRPRANTPITMHSINSELNTMAYYGFEIAPRGNTFGGPYTDEAATPRTYADTDQSFNLYVSDVRDAAPCADLNRRSGQTNWRVPNQMELAIMYFMIQGSTQLLRREGNSHAFMTCTQELYNQVTGAKDTGNAPSRTFRFLTVNVNTNKASEIITATLLANNTSPIDRVRCVRDLTEAEANQTYQSLYATRQRTWQNTQ